MLLSAQFILSEFECFVQCVKKLQYLLEQRQVCCFTYYFCTRTAGCCGPEHPDPDIHIAGSTCQPVSHHMHMHTHTHTHPHTQAHTGGPRRFYLLPPAGSWFMPCLHWGWNLTWLLREKGWGWGDVSGLKVWSAHTTPCPQSLWQLIQKWAGKQIHPRI